ncbi:hypothetical protein [Sinomicrobium oceani]|uniref:hypothetical protein n=1 Tax=Sinomicrobium oceani TaxID=1150368 RepID=UPI000AB71501|nr:hypothetical protein [Sinomicrobium oceani]
MKYAAVCKGVLEREKDSSETYYRSADGWRKMNRLYTSDPVFGWRIPVPAFRIKLTK